MMEQCQPANRDTPSNVRDTSSLSAKEFGTWSAETIRASGHVRRVNRPDTRPHLTIVQINSKISCYAGNIHTRHSPHVARMTASRDKDETAVAVFAPVAATMSFRRAWHDPHLFGSIGVRYRPFGVSVCSMILKFLRGPDHLAQCRAGK